MTTALATTQATALDSVQNWTPDQVSLIKRTVAPEATNDELAMFLHVAAKAGLDPLQKQVWFVKRKQNVGTRENPKWEDRVTIQAGVDGLQARALRMPDCGGIRSAAVYENEDFLFDKKNGEVVRHEGNPFKAPGRPIGAWAIVDRRGRKPFTALVRFDEYYDDRSFLWKGKPAVMIEKVARSTALRRAYPENFGGIYDPAEMGRAAHEPAPQPEPQIDPSPALAAPALSVTAEVVDVKPTPTAEAAEAHGVDPAAAAILTKPVGGEALFEEAKRVWGETRAKEEWRKARRTIWGGATPAPPVAQWTEQQVLDMEFALFGQKPRDSSGDPVDVPF